MFNFGISELMIIAVVGLIVIGPERLPRVARTLGHLFGRMQRYVSEIKADINREVELDELRQLQSSMKEAAQEIEESVSKQVNFIEDEVKQAGDEVKKAEDEVKQADSETRTSVEEVEQAVKPAAGINLVNSLNPPEYPEDRQESTSDRDEPGDAEPKEDSGADAKTKSPENKQA